MATNSKQRESLTHPIPLLETSGIMGGFVVGLGGFLDLSRAGSRVRNVVEKAYPPQHTNEELRRADEDIKSFDRLNGETIRQGGMTISVPPDVAARLQIAYSVQDQELVRLRSQNQLSSELRQQEYVFDPSNFQVGRSVVDLSVCGIGMTMMLAASVSILKKYRNNPT